MDLAAGYKVQVGKYLLCSKSKIIKCLIFLQNTIIEVISHILIIINNIKTIIIETNYYNY